MQITINGKPTDVESSATIASLLQQLQLKPEYVAVERNLELIPRGEHAGCALQPGDRLEVVTLVGGG